MFNFLNNIGPTELIILVIILIVFFGGKAITSLAKTSGESVKEIRKIKKEFTSAFLGGDDNEKPRKTKGRG